MAAITNEKQPRKQFATALLREQASVTAELKFLLLQGTGSTKVEAATLRSGPELDASTVHDVTPNSDDSLGDPWREGNASALVPGRGGRSIQSPG